MDYKLNAKKRQEIVSRMLAGEIGYELAEVYGVNRYYPYQLFRKLQGRGIHKVIPHPVYRRRTFKVAKAKPLSKFKMQDIQAIPVSIETFDEPEWADFCMIVLQ